MANRKFWEKISNTKILFYGDPLELNDTEIDDRIADLQELLALSDEVKALLVQANPTITSEAEFDQIFQDELDQLADQRDYFGSANVTVQDIIEVVDHRWMSPADMTLGPGTIVSVCGEEVGNEAINAIDGVGANNWQHDVDEVHEIVFDLGYSKRICGICVKNTASPGGPFQLSGVNVFVANNLANIDDVASHVGVNLEMTDANRNERDTTIRNGRYVKITVASTGHASNHITVRDFEVRVVPRTKGL